MVKPEGKNHLTDLVIDGRIILKCLKEMRWQGGDWNNLARDRDKNQALTNLLNEFPGSVKRRNFLTI
jgi:hypothetical protein